MARVERCILKAVEDVRRIVPSYGYAELSARDCTRLFAACRIRIYSLNMDTAGYVTPPFAGKRRVFLRESLPPRLRRLLSLHEVGHVVRGEADDFLFFTGGGSLESEIIADTFALCGMITNEKCARGDIRKPSGPIPEWPAERIEESMRLRVALYRTHGV